MGQRGSPICLRTNRNCSCLPFVHHRQWAREKLFTKCTSLFFQDFRGFLRADTISRNSRKKIRHRSTRFLFLFLFSAKFFFSHVVRIFQKSNDEEWSNLISVYLIIQKWEKKFRRRTGENLAMSLQSKSRKIRIERKLVSEKWIDQWNPNWLPWLRRNSIFAARRAISPLLSSYLADYRGDRDLYIYIVFTSRNGGRDLAI